MHDQRSTTNHRQEQKANTRAAILRAAATEFATRGYAGTSIASIAAAMGKPKSAVGHHQFASKQQIAEAIVRQQQETWASMRAEVEQATPPGLGRLLRLLMTAALDAREHPSALAAVRLLADQRANGITLPRSTVPWRAYVAEQFQIDIDAGRIPSDRPAEELARRLLNASFGVFDAESRGLQAIDTEAALRALWADLLAGVGVTDVDAVLEQVGAVDAAPPPDAPIRLRPDRGRAVARPQDHPSARPPTAPPAGTTNAPAAGAARARGRRSWSARAQRIGRMTFGSMRCRCSESLAWASSSEA